MAIIGEPQKGKSKKGNSNFLALPFSDLPFQGISKYTQDLQNTKWRRGRPARPGLESPAGSPAAAWYFPYLGISLYILNISGFTLLGIREIRRPEGKPNTKSNAKGRGEARGDTAEGTTDGEADRRFTEMEGPWRDRGTEGRQIRRRRDDTLQMHCTHYILDRNVSMVYMRITLCIFGFGI